MKHTENRFIVSCFSPSCRNHQPRLIKAALPPRSCPACDAGVRLELQIVTRQQREALRRIHERHCPDKPYLAFRRSLMKFADFVAVTAGGMFIGIEPDGYTHT